MLLAFVIIPVIMLPFLLWLFGIRRYCVRNGKGYTPGANWGVTVWIDWQEASELAIERSDRGMIRLCRLFLLIKLIFAAIGFLTMAAMVAAMMG